MTQETLLLALPYILPVEHQLPARVLVSQVKRALDLVGLDVNLEAILGAWKAIVDSSPGAADLHTLEVILEVAGEPPEASPEDVIAVLDALMRLDDLQAGRGAALATA